MSRCEDEQMWEKMWEKMWRWADVREDVKMSKCEDEQLWEKIWRWADVKMSRCERRCEDEQMWRWADVREDVKMSRCEDEQMWEKMWRWADVKMSRCERRCEDEQMWRWADVKMRRCERRCEDEQMWRWADGKMRRCFTDPHCWKNPALRRSREKITTTSIIWETQCHKPTILYVWGWFIQPTPGDFGDGHGPPKPRLTQLELGRLGEPALIRSSRESATYAVMSGVLKNLQMGMSENGVCPQWNSHLVEIMISKTIGCKATLFSDKPWQINFQFDFSHGHFRKLLQKIDLPEPAKPSLWCSASPPRVPCIPNRSRPVWVGGPWRFVVLFPNDLTILSSNHI